MNPSELGKIIARIEDLPTLPRTVLRITELVNNPKSSARELAKVVTDDQVLTARLLRLVNSSFYGFPQRVATVTGAIVLVGFEAIRNLLLSTSIFDLFSNNKSGSEFQREGLWDHSLGCAVGAKVLGEYLRYENVEEIFVEGLLHDIGKIVEMLFMPEKFASAASKALDDDILITVAEDEMFGYTHAEIGKLLAEAWNLPPKLVSTIAYHHEPSLADRFCYEASIVHLADILCRSLNMGWGGDNRVPILDGRASNILQLDPDSIQTIMEQMEREFEDIAQFIAPLS